MGSISFAADDSFRGEGASEGLARGLLAFFGSQNITQEGMGIGAVALRTGQFTYFSTATKTEIIDSSKIIRTFLINKRLMKAFRGTPSGFLTWLYGKAASLYMSLPSFQTGLLFLADPAISHLNVTNLFEDADTAGEAVVTYLIDKKSVSAECSITLSTRRPCKAYILNELGADFFHSGWHNGSVIPSPSGWRRLGQAMPTPSLYNAQNQLRFYISRLASNNNIPVNIFWGREKAERLCWAGFEFEIDCSRLKDSRFTCDYTVEFAPGGMHD